jgi:GH15 family glucan-1,4-alpha-glucosidase
MDVYGVLIDAHYFIMKEKYETKRINENFIVKVAEKICERWREKDCGIWEIRRSAEHYTYTKVMCWVGIDRILRLKDKFKLNKDQVKKFEKTREEIKSWIWQNCFNSEKKIFEQYPGAGYQDATNFLFVLLQFLDKKDPLTKEIINNTCKELCEDEIWVHRYRNSDGLEGKDNPFLLCTFWMISAWAILEETEKAEELFDKFLSCVSDTGLISEQLDISTGEYLGNFPQAYSHLGLTMCAYYIHRYKNKKKENPPEKILKRKQ